MKLIEAYKSAARKLTVTSPSPEIDAQILIEHLTSLPKHQIFSNPNTPLQKQAIFKLNRLVKRRALGEPIAYLVGHKEFYGYDFIINKNVLIPRPESEELVSLALDRIKNYELRIRQESYMIHNSCFKILDMGTGSGCLVLSLAKEIAKLEISNTKYHLTASDLSRKALAVAKKNYRNLCNDLTIQRFNHLTVNFLRSNLFVNKKLHTQYDVILANLPYVPLLSEGRLGGVSNETIHQLNNCISFEPQDAIFADDNGNAIIKRFLGEAKNRLTPSGAIFLELDPRNAKELKAFAASVFPAKTTITLTKDLSGFDRYLTIKN